MYEQEGLSQQLTSKQSWLFQNIKRQPLFKKWEFLRNLPPLTAPNDLLHISCHYIATTVTSFSAAIYTLSYG